MSMLENSQILKITWSSCITVELSLTMGSSIATGEGAYIHIFHVNCERKDSCALQNSPDISTLKLSHDIPDLHHVSQSHHPHHNDDLKVRIIKAQSLSNFHRHISISILKLKHPPLTATNKHHTADYPQID